MVGCGHYTCRVNENTRPNCIRWRTLEVGVVIRIVVRIAVAVAVSVSVTKTVKRFSRSLHVVALNRNWSLTCGRERTDRSEGNNRSLEKIVQPLAGPELLLLWELHLLPVWQEQQVRSLQHKPTPTTPLRPEMFQWKSFSDEQKCRTLTLGL